MFKSHKKLEVVALDIRPSMRDAFLQGGLYSETCTVYFSNGTKKQIHQMDELIWYPAQEFDNSFKGLCDKADAKRREIDQLFDAAGKIVRVGLRGGK